MSVNKGIKLKIFGVIMLIGVFFIFFTAVKALYNSEFGEVSDKDYSELLILLKDGSEPKKLLKKYMIDDGRITKDEYNEFKIDLKEYNKKHILNIVKDI